MDRTISKDKCADCSKTVSFPYSICWDCERPLCPGDGNAKPPIVKCGMGKELRCRRHHKSWILREGILFEGYK